jgi:hypothetical protein
MIRIEEEITGRDGYILRKALAYAIVAVERLPERWQERSDREDMIRLLAAIGDGEFYLLTARAKLERRGLTSKDGRLALRQYPSGPIVDFPGAGPAKAP